ncbi:MAG: hypothetical protein CMO98_10435 [Woeseia sp.]|nr:hypothetical protein [Woeseia sp.]
MPNPLLSRVAPESMDDRVREAYEHSHSLQKRKNGDATFFEIGANAPEVLNWYFENFYGKLFYGGRVDTRTKELLRYRLSMTHGCAFCNKGNIEDARKAGVTETQLANIMDKDHTAFSEKDRAVMELASEMSLPNMNGQLTPKLYASLCNHFDDGEIFELGLVAGILTGAAKFLFVFDLVERETNCPITPLPTK